MYKRHSRNSKVTKIVWQHQTTGNEKANRKFEKAQEEIKETIEALYKHESETKNKINKEINELRIKTDNIKEETTQDKENLRKKNETELQNKMEGQSRRIEQTEDRISELEDEM
jgi:vacuolar-type H+-ATPase subunit I/STV1